MSTLPPAGWYDDPEHPGYLRYWDGAIWTDHRSPVAGSGGAATAGRLSDIGTWLNRTFADIWGRKVPLLVIGGLLLVLWAIAGLLIAWSVDDLVYVDGDWQGFDGGEVSLAAFGLLAVGMGSIVLYVAVVHQLYWARFGENQTAGASLAAAASATPRVIGWSVALGAVALGGLLVLVLVTVVVPPVGVLLILMMVPLGIWLWVKVAFFLVAIVARGAERNPFKSSAAVSSSGRFWAVFGRLLLLAVIGSAVAYVLTLPFGAGGPGDFDDIIVTDGSDNLLYFHVGDFVDELGFGGGGLIVLLASIPQMISSLIGVAGTTGLYAEVAGRTDA